MNKRKVLSFSMIAIIALLGIIITQVLWVYDAHELRKEQFMQRVKVALKSVSTQILDAQIDSSAKYLITPCDTDFLANRTITDIIDAEHLEVLVVNEFGSLFIVEEYSYGVFNSIDSSFIMGSYEGNEDQLILSQHQTSLSCIYKDEVYILAVHFPHENRVLFNSMIMLIILSLLFLIVLILSFYMILRLMFRQKKLSQVKSDFINNMTHEFKTPIATISISSEMLLKPDVNKFPYKTKRYANVIFDENARLQKQVEQVLQLSVLERGEHQLKLKEIDAHRIIRRMADHYSVKVAKKGGMISTQLNAAYYTFKADKTHFSNIIANLIDNATKYSGEHPEIKISTEEKYGKFHLQIMDNGIGISTENQKHIFKKLYRVPTGNIHDVKGFGLGLYYVKTMVEAHGGSISVKSELGKGTTFLIILPINQKT